MLSFLTSLLPSHSLTLFPYSLFPLSLSFWLLPLPPSLHPSHSIVWWSEGGVVVCVVWGAERRSVGIITVWRTRMDLYAISVVGCCANLPSTNGTAMQCRRTSWYQSKALNQQKLSLCFWVSPCEQFNNEGTRQLKKTYKIFHMKTGMGRQQGVQQCSNAEIKPESAY